MAAVWKMQTKFAKLNDKTATTFSLEGKNKKNSESECSQPENNFFGLVLWVPPYDRNTSF